MKIDLEKDSQNIAKVEIEIPAKDGLDAYNRAVKAYAQHVNIPGFRRGKAPRNIVERQVGKERIISEALETLLPSAFQQAKPILQRVAFQFSVLRYRCLLRLNFHLRRLALPMRLILCSLQAIKRLAL